MKRIAASVHYRHEWTREALLVPCNWVHVSPDPKRFSATGGKQRGASDRRSRREAAPAFFGTRIPLGSQMGGGQAEQIKISTSREYFEVAFLADIRLGEACLPKKPQRHYQSHRRHSSRLLD